MVANVELRRVDANADIRAVIAAVNVLVDRDLGNSSGQIKHYGYSGVRQQPVGSGGVAAGAVTSSANYTHDVHSAHASGLLAAFRLPATAKDVPATIANCAVLIQAAGLSIGAGKALTLYASGGVNNASLTSDAAGNLILGGTTGDLTLNGNVKWKSGTAFTMTFDHTATADRTVTFQDLAGTVAELGVQNAGNLLFVDATYDLGATGATRPRDLFLSRDAVIGGALTVTGGQIAFPATQNPSANVNTLDDYEELPWTPVLVSAGATTYAVQAATYTKIGRAVFITCTLIINVKAAGASVQSIDGLPFTVGSVAGTAAVNYWASSATNYVFLTGLISPGTTQIDLYGATVATASLSAATFFQNSARVQFAGFYFV